MMWCAVLVALAVLIWPGNKSGRLYRLAYRGRAVDSAAINEPRYADSPRVGVAQVITSAIERNAAKLSVKLLMPTGLCFLPAFVLVGVIPAIASFMM